MKSIKIYVVILALILGAMIYVDATRPKPINWNKTYNVKDKIPYGMFVLDNEIEKQLKADTIERINTTAYEYFSPLYDYDTLVKDYKVRGTILSINDEYIIDDESTDELFYFVGHGNNCFISAEDFAQKLKDSLHFDIEAEFDVKNNLTLSLANKNLDSSTYKMNKSDSNGRFFSKIDTLNTTVLGYQVTKEKKQINFIKVPYRNGFFYLHTQPICFTNSILLKDNLSHYTEKVISYIPNGKVFWLLKFQNGLINNDTMLGYMVNQPALKWTWYLFLLGMLFFILFNAKRKQRIVPILKPLTNTTVDFTKTIGNLYYQEANHQNIIDKKIVYFLEKVRNEYLIETTVLDEIFVKKLHLKTGKKIEDIETVVRLINYQRKSYHQSIEEDLLEINTAMEKIFGE